MENKKVTLTGTLSLRPKGKRLQAFTLVELIVVITILAILGTIAFISLQGYSQDARDSVRISDMSKIKTTLELFQLDTGKYPETTTPTNITYSGAIAWTQGTFGTLTFNNVTKLDKIPTDPVSDRQYVYSVTNTKQEYQLAGIMEGDVVSYNPLAPLSAGIATTNAAGKTAMLKISGTYNGKILKVFTGGINYVLAVPSIITSSGFTLEQIVAGNTLAYNGYKNLPAQYAGSSYEVLGDPLIKLVNNVALVVYSGSLLTLSDTTSTGTIARANLITNLQNAYTGTTITGIGEISQILSTSTTDSTATEFLGTTIVSNNLGGSISVSSGGGTQTLTNSCVTQPSYAHATFIVGTPTSVAQAYVKDATNCGYTCTDGYTGTNCEIAPSVTFLSNCTANGQIIYTDAIGIEIGRVNNTGSTLSGNPGSLTCAGHIIMCSGNNAGYILKACNVGATTVLTDTTSYGGLFQWGNHFDFRYNQFTNGQVYPTTSTTQVSSIPDYSTYSSSTFVKSSDWTSLDANGALRSANWNPCSSGYHVPTNAEWGSTLLAGGWGTTLGTNMINTLKLPMAGTRSPSDASMFDLGTYGRYWSSTTGSYNTNLMFFSSTNINKSSNDVRAYGLSVRCFKN